MCFMASLIVQLVKNMSAMQETWVQSLGQVDPLEREMATHSSIAWRIPWTKEPGGLQSIGCKESDTTEQVIHTHTHTHTHIILKYIQQIYN